MEVGFRISKEEKKLFLKLLASVKKIPLDTMKLIYFFKGTKGLYLFKFSKRSLLGSIKKATL